MGTHGHSGVFCGKDARGFQKDSSCVFGVYYTLMIEPDQDALLVLL